MLRFPFSRLLPLRVLSAVLWAAPLSLVWANTALQPVPKGGEGWQAFHRGFLDRAKKGDIEVLFLGDSITQYWEKPEWGLPVWEREFAGLPAANFGINGDRLQHILWRIQNGETSGISPKVVVFLAGTNNTTPRNTTEEVIAGISACLETLQKNLPETKILLLGLFPRGKADDPKRAQIAEINQALARLQDERQVWFLDFGGRFLDEDGQIPETLMPDLLHPNREGYEIMAAEIKPAVLRLLDVPAGAAVP